MARKYTTRAAPKKPRGENWEAIHANLELFARRIVMAKGGLSDIQVVYECMALAKKYEEKTSSTGIAKKLEEKDRKYKESEEEREAKREKETEKVRKGKFDIDWD